MEIWKFLAGLGLFLYGMGLMETVLKNVAGLSIKLFLKRNTQNVYKAIVSGTGQCVFADKAIKDIAYNLNDFEASATDILHNQCAIIRNE
jgi:hypothetical protein